MSQNVERTRGMALRDFAITIAGVSAFAGTGLYFYSLSSIPEPWKTGLVIVIIIAWVAGGVGLAFTLRRDLTPVMLTEEGLGVGRRVIPYRIIQAVDPRPGRKVFRTSLDKPRKDLMLSKIGLRSEDQFFGELSRRIKQHRDSMV